MMNDKQWKEGIPRTGFPPKPGRMPSWVRIRYFGRVIEPGRVYELGYERCTCPMVLSGQVVDPDLCNCSRQSILYILGRLEPSSDFEVEIIETVLRGAKHCRFRITKK